MRYKIKDVARGYVLAYCRFLDETGLSLSYMESYNLLKDSLDSIYKLKYKSVTRFCLRFFCYLYLRLRCKTLNLSYEARVNLVKYCLSYYIAGSIIGGDYLYYLEVETTKYGVFALGSDLRRHQVEEMLDEMFPEGYCVRERKYLGASEDWVLFTSINHSKVSYSLMLGVICIEYSGEEMLNEFRRIFGYGCNDR